MSSFKIEELLKESDGDLRLIAEALLAFRNGDNNELAQLGALVEADKYLCLNHLRSAYSSKK